MKEKKTSTKNLPNSGFNYPKNKPDSKLIYNRSKFNIKLSSVYTNPNFRQ